ncbi:alpha/beta fold hydrolase [Malikia granosa]|uniref:Alpha/beta hydrolase n=1 Tax=Malikia granosa TaxID=263067 RepID=A0A2S9K3H9_9BURK|nr:alpha/beta hydrolase [Malikia granosa]PRD64935.1 alpha/beta hydrolase [Malikia granosa]
MYQAIRTSSSRFLTIREQRYHVRRWGEYRPGSVPLVLLHGWMDVSASFQFVVDALSQQRFIIAPDWRGFGLTRPLGAGQDPTDYGPVDHYVSPAEYLADLDFLLDALDAELGRDSGAAIDLVGHSMGGNTAMIYAGVRPGRVRRLVNLEGFGLPATRPAQAARRYANWIDQLKALERGELALQQYDSLEGVAQRLIKTNPRLDAAKAHWLAQHWSARNEAGRWQILGDAAHKVVSALLYRADEAQAIWRCIQAPTLMVEASDDSLARWFKQGEYTLDEFHQRLTAVPDCRRARVEDAGHMLHHDQPAAVAQLIEEFLD